MAGNKHLPQILKEYKAQSPHYEDLAKSVKKILGSLLKENNFFYQTTTYRLKNLPSLAKKVSDGNYKKLSDIYDVAGCRVIFYLESDIDRFTRLIYEEFGKENIVKYALKYSEEGYNAQHVVIKLNKERLGLSEYSKFKGLVCEIQLTTVLFHAWSEMEHDTIYKPKKELQKFNQEYFKSLEDEFSKIMKDHIKQASYSFEFIYMNMEHLKKGKQIFSLDFFKSVSGLTSNNEIYENLKLLHNYVERFGDKAPKELGIIELIKGILEKSKKLKIEERKTIIGTLKGIGYSEVAVLCIEILEELRYLHTREIFRILVELSSSADKPISERALKAIEKLSQYTLHVLQKVSYYPQDIILSEIKKWDNKILVKNLPAMNASLRKVLDTTFEGHSMKDYKTFTWQSGSLKGSEKLEEIRSNTIVFLKKTYPLCKSVPEQVSILNTLNEATHTPRQGNYGQDIIDAVVKSTNEIIDFYISIVKTSENRVVKEIDEQAQWFQERFGSSLLRIDELEKLIKESKSYNIYRVFVGYEYRYRGTDNWKDAQEERSKKIKEYVKDFSKKTYEKWKEIILSISKDKNEKTDMSEFQHFFTFLTDIAKEKPDLALKLIKESEEELEPIILNLFSGLWQSVKHKQFKTMVEAWVKKGDYLNSFSSMQIYFPPIDKTLLKELLKKAIEKSDTRTINNVIQAVVFNFDGAGEMKQIFMNTIASASKLKDSDWVFSSWVKLEKILQDLTEKESMIVLDNLITSPRVDYHVEEALGIISIKSPASVVNFFHRRIQHKLKNKDEKYDAIPYDFHGLNEKLSPHGKNLLPIILAWYKEKDWLFRWEASRLIQNIYPQFNSELEALLLERIKTGGEDNADIVMHILDGYDGEIFTHKVCKEFIKKYKKEKYQRSMRIFLSKTGTVMGEYGLVEAYKKKIDEIQSWKEEKDPTILTFIKSYEKSLNSQIVFEKKNADGTIEMMKKTYGS